MKDGSKETLDRVSPIFMSTSKNNSSMAIHLRTYGAGWFTFLFRGSSPGKRGQQKLFGIPTFRRPSTKMSTFHLPLRGSQSNHFIFHKRPDTNSGPLLPILLHSKAETRYVHGGRQVPLGCNCFSWVDVLHCWTEKIWALTAHHISISVSQGGLESPPCKALRQPSARFDWFQTEIQSE